MSVYVCGSYWGCCLSYTALCLHIYIRKMDSFVSPQIFRLHKAVVGRVYMYINDRMPGNWFLHQKNTNVHSSNISNWFRTSSAVNWNVYWKSRGIYELTLLFMEIVVGYNVTWNGCHMIDETASFFERKDC